MANTTLSARVLTLEKTVATLMERLQPREPGRDDWRASVGMFDGDEGMKRVDEQEPPFAVRNAERHGVIDQT